MFFFLFSAREGRRRRTLATRLEIDVSVEETVKINGTSQRVYQELVNRNEVFKTMVTGFTSPSLPSLHAIFPTFFRSAFPIIREFETG